ncbi:MAG: hypothetical protein VX948_05950 [Candidatus Latescibacterota bacterium]|nr:hypothetical protein [Candidatus Latescibacterota bacterium]
MSRVLWAAALLCIGCGWLNRGVPRGPSPEAALHAAIGEWGAVDTVTVLGFRDHWGKSTAGVDVLDAALLSALGHHGVVVNPDAGIVAPSTETLRYRDGGVLPTGWQDLTGDTTPRHGLVVAGQIRKADAWTYLRLALADATTGQLRAHGTTRISQQRLDDLVASALEDTVGALQPVDVVYHVVGRRDNAGFAELIDVEEGVTLIEGDRLQIRLKTDQDCEVFAFLYASEGGERRNLLDPQRVYEGRWNYGPAENSWITLTEGDQVYTLYLLVAPRIDEDRSALWEEVTQLQAQGQIDRMSGLELVDDALAGFLQQAVSTTDSTLVLRGNEGLQRAEEPETFAYVDGTVFEHHADILQGVAMIRAISFHVRFE